MNTVRRKGPVPIREAFKKALLGQDNVTRLRVNNSTLRDTLGWKQARYDRVRAELLKAGVIEVCVGGPGGSVMLRSPSILVPSPLTVFMSYSHKDSDTHNHLRAHLRPLERSGLIAPWTDRKLVAGDDFDKKISDELVRAKIVLLLISIDFLNSAYCYDKEMKTALERHDANQCRVIPIIARPCLWELSPFQGLQALPDQVKAISAWSNIDEAFVNVVQGIQKAAEHMRSAAY